MNEKLISISEAYVKLLILTLLIIGCSTNKNAGTPSFIAKGVCAIDFRWANGGGTITSGVEEALNGRTFSLNEKKIFYHLKGKDSDLSTVKTKRPYFLKNYLVHLKLSKDRNINWNGNEKISLEFKVLDNSEKVLFGPFESSLVRPIQNFKEFNDPLLLPSLSTNLVLGGKKVKVHSSCGARI